MRDQQTIDLRASRMHIIEEQNTALAHLEHVAASEGFGEWSDDHAVHSLLLRYEHASWDVGTRFARRAIAG